MFSSVAPELFINLDNFTEKMFFLKNLVHRIGRTGRSSKTGLATTFINKTNDESVLLDLKHLLIEAKQKVPPFLAQLQSDNEKYLDLGGMFQNFHICISDIFFFIRNNFFLVFPKFSYSFIKSTIMFPCDFSIFFIKYVKIFLPFLQCFYKISLNFHKMTIKCFQNISNIFHNFSIFFSKIALPNF